MGESGGQEAMCVICHDGVLTQQASALLCGHVFHSACIETWMSQCKGQCPTCKRITPPSQLRPLNLEVIELLPEMISEVRRFVDGSKEDRSRIVEELNAERERQEAEIRSLREELAAAELEAATCKSDRRMTREAGPRKDEELVQLKQQRDRAQLEFSEMQQHLDREQQRHFRKLPIAETREDDPDCLAERKKLRQVRATDRLRYLHEALLSAKALETESLQLSKARSSSALEIESEVKTARQQELQMKQQLSDMRKAAAAASTPRSQDTMSTPPTPVSKALPSKRRPAPGETVADKVSTGLAEARREAEEDAMLFAGPAKQRRPAALGGKANPLGSVVTPSRKPLFTQSSVVAKRRV
eukprot:TRINITY_DN41348_c0_g1_i1.p1 TRINITY_DN41348_c0_g1~~TRINITY_DN41348_c0_g1_i1.p1  ORF type:complete len:385 (+),score=83.45 TRINITY_DN41348_c0_g1_i1:84-1157(+)